MDHLPDEELVRIRTNIDLMTLATREAVQAVIPGLPENTLASMLVPEFLDKRELSRTEIRELVETRTDSQLILTVLRTVVNKTLKSRGLKIAVRHKPGTSPSTDLWRLESTKIKSTAEVSPETVEIHENSLEIARGHPRLEQFVPALVGGYWGVPEDSLDFTQEDVDMANKLLSECGGKIHRLNGLMILGPIDFPIKVPDPDEMPRRLSEEELEQIRGIAANGTYGEERKALLLSLVKNPDGVPLEEFVQGFKKTSVEVRDLVAAISYEQFRDTRFRIYVEQGIVFFGYKDRKPRRAPPHPIVKELEREKERDPRKTLPPKERALAIARGIKSPQRKHLITILAKAYPGEIPLRKAADILGVSTEHLKGVRNNVNKELFVHRGLVIIYLDKSIALTTTELGLPRPFCDDPEAGERIDDLLRSSRRPLRKKFLTMLRDNPDGLPSEEVEKELGLTKEEVLLFKKRFNREILLKRNLIVRLRRGVLFLQIRDGRLVNFAGEKDEKPEIELVEIAEPGKVKEPVLELAEPGIESPESFGHRDVKFLKIELSNLLEKPITTLQVFREVVSLMARLMVLENGNVTSVELETLKRRIGNLLINQSLVRRIRGNFVNTIDLLISRSVGEVTPDQIRQLTNPKF